MEPNPRTAASVSGIVLTGGLGNPIFDPLQHWIGNIGIKPDKLEDCHTKEGDVRFARRAEMNKYCEIFLIPVRAITVPTDATRSRNIFIAHRATS